MGYSSFSCVQAVTLLFFDALPLAIQKAPSNLLHTSHIELSMKQTARKKMGGILISNYMILNSLIGIL